LELWLFKETTFDMAVAGDKVKVDIIGVVLAWLLSFCFLVVLGCYLLFVFSSNFFVVLEIKDYDYLLQLLPLFPFFLPTAQNRPLERCANQYGILS
jgi:hypothetical protein